MMAEIAVLAIENLDDHLLHTIIPILVLTLIQVIFAYLSLKNQKSAGFSMENRRLS